jgi:hypothetical protein
MKYIVQLVLTGICAAIVGVLAYFAAITVSFVPGVAAVYPATAVEAAFGAWFGLWGAFASYLGLVVSGTLAGWFSLVVGLLLSVSDFIVAIFPAAAVRLFKLNPALPRFRDKAYFLLAAMAGSVVSSIYYNFLQLKLGLLPSWDAFFVALVGWNVGNLFILVVIGIPLLVFATPAIKSMNLFIQKWI